MLRTAVRYRRVWGRQRVSDVWSGLMRYLLRRNRVRQRRMQYRVHIQSVSDGLLVPGKPVWRPYLRTYR